MLHLQSEKAQSAYRYTYCLSGWRATVQMSLDHLVQYHGMCLVATPARLKEIRTRKFGADHEPYDIHPLNEMLALLFALLGGVAAAIVLVLLLTVKLLPILARAYSNHVKSTSAWAPFPGQKRFNPAVSLGYFSAYLLIPVAAAAAFPLIALYGFVLSERGAMAVREAHGNFGPGIASIRGGIKKVRDAAAQSVPVAACGSAARPQRQRGCHGSSTPVALRARSCR